MGDDALASGREAFAGRRWGTAHRLLVAADEWDSLEAPDLEQLAFACYMIGSEDEMVSYLDRAHQLHLEAGSEIAAARAAIWIGIDLALRGETGPASGWFARAGRMVERHGEPCAEAGYLMIPVMLQQVNMGNHDGAIAAAQRAIEIGQAFAEPNLVALALHGQGRALVKMGKVDEGLRLLDEAMVAVTTDDLLPIVTGIIYCSVIEGCYEVQELRRAHSWTESLSDWCGSQPDLVAFTGQCLTHRSELMQIRGSWDDALSEAERAGERFLSHMNQLPAAQAHYRQGELHRLRGDEAEAEAAFRRASQWGWAPQPGLALLRLAQGEQGASARSLRTHLGETSDPIERARLLPALAEALIAADDLPGAMEASEELSEIASTYAATMIAATAAFVRGMVFLTAGELEAAIAGLNDARARWSEFGAPYEVARVQALLGETYRALGDYDSADLETAAARATFEALGARPDLARLAGAIEKDDLLTDRELQVLELVARGHTNKAIAQELFVSNRTVERHLSNIFTKLGVSTRTAAAAYAFERNRD